MSVYIKGMEIPTRCFECPMCCVDTCGILCCVDSCCISHGSYIEYREVDVDTAKNGRPDWCPLIPVPLHGDLIDRDALMDDLKRQCKEVFRIDAVSPEDFWINRNEAYRQRLYESWCEGFYEYVGSRPTIIPAEEEGEE